MSSGLAWDETSVPYGNPSNTYWRMGAAPRADQFVLAQPVAAQAGEVFDYNTGTADLLGVILRKVSGKRLDEFAKETLFDPLGIEDWDWDGSSGFNPAAASGLRLRPRDLAKIGQLVLPVQFPLLHSDLNDFSSPRSAMSKMECRSVSSRR
jgi:CubicO group peptidase (beta-lactamase class C family)